MRGAQKTPTKLMISLRVDRDVLEAYRATGKGWQGRMNETLAAHVPDRRRRTASRPKKRASSRSRRKRAR
jgi:BrnA antitoxin of type II toxin-antitoxin system